LANAARHNNALTSLRHTGPIEAAPGLPHDPEECQALAPTEGIAVPERGFTGGAGALPRGVALELALAVAVLLIAVIQVGLVMRGVAPLAEGRLLDTDDYMRLARVRHLWESGLWFDAVFPRINPPDGMVLHWTRPLDVLLLAGALAAAPLVGFETGLFWWGALISPLLQVASLFLLVWAVSPLLRRNWIPFLAFLFVAQPAIFGRFMVGRPDHHGLLILLFIISVGLTLRMLRDPARDRTALWAGLTAAMAVWVSVEALLINLTAIAALGLFWLLGDRRLARSLVLHAGATVCGLGLALLIERGPAGLGQSEIDRISFAHLFLFGVNLLFWIGVWTLQERKIMPSGLGPRMAWSVLGAAGAGAVLWALQPGFFVDPMTNGDSLYKAVHLANVQEMQPLLRLTAAPDESWLGLAVKPLLWLGIAVPALPWLVYRLVTESGFERRAWAFFGLAALVFVPLALFQVRWSLYAELLLIVPCAALIGAALEWLATRLPIQALGIVRPFLVTAFCVWIYLPGMLSEDGGNAKAAAANCPINSLTTVLADPAGLGAAPKRILALIDFGPELLYRTPHSVFAIPNHRFQPGFTVGYRIMSAKDFALSETLLREAQVDLIVICPGSAEDWFYGTDEDGRTLYRALKDGERLGFLDAVALPDGLVGSFKVFAPRTF
jgi:hypothetical protein